MPFNFSGGGKGSAYVAKLGVVSDGDTFIVADGYGHTVTSLLHLPTAFANVPTRSSTGVWSVPLLDSVVVVLDFHVATIVPGGTYLGAQLNPVTTNAAGQQVLNWTFNVAGTPTDLPSTGTPQFLVYVAYSETTY